MAAYYGSKCSRFIPQILHCVYVDGDISGTLRHSHVTRHRGRWKLSFWIINIVPTQNQEQHQVDFIIWNPGHACTAITFVCPGIICIVMVTQVTTLQVTECREPKLYLKFMEIRGQNGNVWCVSDLSITDIRKKLSIDVIHCLLFVHGGSEKIVETSFIGKLDHGNVIIAICKTRTPRR